MRFMLMLFLLTGCLSTPPPTEGLELACSPCAESIWTGPAFEPYLAVDPEDTDRAALIMKGGSAGFVGLRTQDGGRDWTPFEVPVPADPADGLWTAFGDPMGAFLDGRFVAGGIGHVPRPAQTPVGRDIVAITVDPSVSYTPVFDGSGVYLNSPISSDAVPVAWNNGDKPWMASRGDGLGMTWTVIRDETGGTAHGSDRNALLYATTDGGPWSDPLLVSDIGAPAFSALAFTEDGPIIAFVDSVDNTLYVVEGPGAPPEAVTKVRGQPLLIPSDGALWMVLPEVMSEAIRYSLWRDTGEWERVAVMGRSGNATFGLASAAVDESGNVHIAWYEEGPDLAFRAAAWTPAGLLGPLDLDRDIHAPTSSQTGGYGDYVVASMPAEAGVRHVWLGGGEERQVRTGLLHVT